MTLLQVDYITNMLPECCRAGFCDVSVVDSEESDRLRRFLPGVNSVVILAHHVQHSMEWVWFPFSAERSGTTCAADLHLRAIAESVAAHLRSLGVASALLPYPDPCGVHFKTLAVNSGIGQLGDSCLLLHPEWGPWTHLRALLTEASFDCKEAGRQVSICLHCGMCERACPSGAISESQFNGIVCRDFQRAERARLGSRYAGIWKCEECARACPVGEAPPKVALSFELERHA